MSFNLSSYPTLSQYAVFSSTALSSTDLTTIRNGDYGVAPGNPAKFSGTLNTAGVTNASAELNSLIPAITTHSLGLDNQLELQASYPVGTTLTLYPNVNNFSASTLVFTGTKIILDALNMPNAQFFINAGTSITFGTVPNINIVNAGTNCNVFWIAQAAISFTGTSPPSIGGVYIAGTAISFAGASNIYGRLYAKAAITFVGPSSVNGSCGIAIINGIPININYPISNICFLGNTPIQTDQGMLAIEDIDDSHTIKNEKFKITKTITNDKYLICFEKDSLGKNYPNKKTIMSKSHKIYYKGKMVQAGRIRSEGVHKIKYNGEILYNILMDYKLIKVNNLFCETLHPDNIIAKLYNHSSKDKEILIKDLNDSILNEDVPKYVRTIKRITK